jgi:hypothetical protein
VIPLLAALPVVQGVVGSVSGIAGGVMGSFGPSEPTAPAPATSLPFSSALNQATKSIHATPSITSPGIMRADQWNEMSGTDLQSWAQSLTGHHIDATDAAGHAISGVVSGVQQTGNDVSLNVGGHLVSLSDLKQVSWSATAV